ELLGGVETAAAWRNSQTETAIAAGARQDRHPVQRLAKQSAVAETTIADRQDDARSESGSVGRTAKIFEQDHGSTRKVVLLDSLDVGLDLFGRSLFARLFECGNLEKAHRQRAWRNVRVGSIQRRQQGEVQESQSPHQIETELGRLRVALIE